MVAVEQGHHRELSHYHLPSDRSSRLVCHGLCTMRPLWPLKRTSLLSSSAREEKEPTPSSLFNRSFRNHAHTVTHIHTHTWQHVCIYTHSHTGTLTHTHTHLHSHTLRHTHSCTLTLTLLRHTLIHIYIHRHSDRHSYTLTLTYAQTPAYCVS